MLLQWKSDGVTLKCRNILQTRIGEVSGQKRYFSATDIYNKRLDTGMKKNYKRIITVFF